MPQMAPISWLILFFLFTFAFMLFNILNYYCFFYNNNKNNNNSDSTINSKINNNFLNWKW